MKSTTSLIFLTTVVMATITLSVGQMANVAVAEGGNATFTCDFVFEGVEPGFDYEIVWEAEGKLTASTRIAKYTSATNEGFEYKHELTKKGKLIPSGNQLTIVGARLADNDLMSTITCVVETGTQSQTHVATYTVYKLASLEVAAAQLSKSDGVYEASDGDSKLIGTCTSGYAFPQPVVEFYRDGSLIEKLNKTAEDLEGFFGFARDGIEQQGEYGQVNMKRDLFMILSEEDDKTEISCRITTTYEDISDTIEVPMGQIRITHPVSKVTITAPEGPYKEGDVVTFKCEHNGYPESFVQKFGVGETVNTSPEVDITMTSDMDGDYVMCSAATQTQDEPASNTFPLTVQYNKAVMVSGAGEAKIGTTVTLECSSNSKPASMYTWKKDEMVVGTGATYTIESAMFDSAGSYVCVSKNAASETMSVAHQLNVNGIELRSAVSEKVATEEIAETGITMTCSAESSAKPTFVWMKKGEGEATAVEWSETLMVESADDGRMHSQTVSIKDVNSAYSMMQFTCTVSLDDDSHTSTFEIGEIKESGGPAGIIVAILVILLIIVIIIGVLYYKGIICKKDGKSGDETADDIEVDIRKDDDVESGAIEGDKLLENGDN